MTFLSQHVMQVVFATGWGGANILCPAPATCGAERMQSPPRPAPPVIPGPRQLLTGYRANGIFCSRDYRFYGRVLVFFICDCIFYGHDRIFLIRDHDFSSRDDSFTVATVFFYS